MYTVFIAIIYAYIYNIVQNSWIFYILTYNVFQFLIRIPTIYYTHMRYSFT